MSQLVLPRSKFSWIDLARMAEPTQRAPIILIIDEYEKYVGQPGLMTVTNDIDQVIEFICDIRHISPEERLWVYMDSMGQYSGFDVDDSSFYPIILPEPNSIIRIINSQQVQQRLKDFPNEM